MYESWELNVNGGWCESTIQQSKIKLSRWAFSPPDVARRRYWNLNEQFNFEMFAVAKMLKYYFNPSLNEISFPAECFPLNDGETLMLQKRYFRWGWKMTNEIKTDSECLLVVEMSWSFKSQDTLLSRRKFTHKTHSALVRNENQIKETKERKEIKTNKWWRNCRNKKRIKTWHKKKDPGSWRRGKSWKFSPSFCLNSDISKIINRHLLSDILVRKSRKCFEAGNKVSWASSLSLMAKSLN